MPNLTQSGVTFTYGEVSFGQNRSIQISDGTGRHSQYTLTPNPHNDPWYNNNQPRF